MIKFEKIGHKASSDGSVTVQRFRMRSLFSNIFDMYSPPEQVRLTRVYNGHEGAMRDLQNLKRDVRKVMPMAIDANVR
jgi:hypothetical protein